VMLDGSLELRVRFGLHSHCYVCTYGLPSLDS
jgi:hypothetical protein